jgi:hypothetical protein
MTTLLGRFVLDRLKDESGMISHARAETDQDDNVLRTNRSKPNCAISECFWRGDDQIRPSEKFPLVSIDGSFRRCLRDCLVLILSLAVYSSQAATLVVWARNSLEPSDCRQTCFAPSHLSTKWGPRKVFIRENTSADLQDYSLIDSLDLIRNSHQVDALADF